MRAETILQNLYNPMDCRPAGSSVHGDSPGKNTGIRLPFASPGDLPKPGIEPASPALQADSLATQPPGKPILQERVVIQLNIIRNPLGRAIFLS